MPAPHTDPSVYFLEVEAHFAARRGTPFVLSARDWILMKAWQQAGVPLPVVIEAIDRCFEKAAEGGRRKMISSLRYCRHAVVELWEERKDLLIGAEGSLPETDAAGQLAHLAADLHGLSHNDPAIEKVIHSVADEITRISASSIPQIEDRLVALEGELFETLLGMLDPSELQSILGEIDLQLGQGAKLDASTVERSRQANLRRILRGRFGLPRLSLFR